MLFKRPRHLVSRLSRTAGRNHHGVITCWHRGGGNKKLYRIVDFKRSLFHVPAVVLRIEYDPNRSSFIALICYQNGLLSYILSPKDLTVGSFLSSGPFSELSLGSSLPLGFIPVGSFVHCVERLPGKGGQFTRSSGTFSKIIKKDQNHVLVRLSSNQVYSFSPLSMATLGLVSNRRSSSLYKAGQSRWFNRRPVVRGVAMNPVDHPHGGGEGRSKGGGHPVSPWGKLTKGKPTRRSSFRLSVHGPL